MQNKTDHMTLTQRHEEYARRKAQWQRLNPTASDKDYERMIAALIKELRI